MKCRLLRNSNDRAQKEHWHAWIRMDLNSQEVGLRKWKWTPRRYTSLPRYLILLIRFMIMIMTRYQMRKHVKSTMGMLVVVVEMLEIVTRVIWELRMLPAVLGSCPLRRRFTLPLWLGAALRQAPRVSVPPTSISIWTITFCTSTWDSMPSMSGNSNTLKIHELLGGQIEFDRR